MPVSKHRRRGKTRQRVGQVRAGNQRIAEMIYDAASEWDWQTRQPGHQGGVIGRSARWLLYLFLFDDWQNARTKPLEMSLDALAATARMSRSTITEALRRLRELGILNQQEIRREGRRPIYVYAVRSPSQWVGYREPAVLPAAPGTESDYPPPPL